MGNIDNSISLEEAAARRGVSKRRITQQVLEGGWGIRKIDRNRYVLSEDDKSYSGHKKSNKTSDQERLEYENAYRERLDLTEDPRFENNISRVDNRVELEAEIAAVFKNFNAKQMYEKLKTFGIAYGRLNSVKALSEHSDLRRVKVETTSGPANIPAPPAKIDEETIALGSVPELGQHTAAIRKEFE